MARRVKTVTAKAGATAAERRVLAAITTTTAIPTLSTDGELLQQNEVVHLLWSISGTTPVFRIRIWLYSDISGTWHKDDQVVVDDDTIVTVEVDGLNRIYLQSEVAPTGTLPVLSAWIALVRPV